MPKSNKVNISELEQNEKKGLETKECFVIMPISNQEGYDNGHFDWV